MGICRSGWAVCNFFHSNMFIVFRVEESCYRPKLAAVEIPDRIFQVDDSEIRAEMVLSREERDRLDMVYCVFKMLFSF